MAKKQTKRLAQELAMALHGAHSAEWEGAAVGRGGRRPGSWRKAMGRKLSDSGGKDREDKR
jgi:hypothetical protein